MYVYKKRSFILVTRHPRTQIRNTYIHNIHSIIYIVHTYIHTCIPHIQKGERGVDCQRPGEGHPGGESNHVPSQAQLGEEALGIPQQLSNGLARSALRLTENICMYVCVCKYVCMNVWWIHACLCMCMCVNIPYVYVCTYVCMYVCINMWIVLFHL